MKRILIVLSLMFSVMVQAQEAQKTYDDIKSTLGLVPTFMKQIPEAAVPGVWAEMKGLQLSGDTVIPGKYKELIGLAVSAQIPCKYCVHFHTQAAILNGATQTEIKEAINMAACSRKWSAFLYGTQQDESQFKTEIDKIHAVMKKNMSKQAQEVKPVVTEINTAEDAYKDIENTFGFVPSFMKNYPKGAIAGAWKDMKSIELNPNSALPGKYKDLIGLAVSAQIPCRYCTYYYTQNGIMGNATKDELIEAVAMAGFTREMSTYLNGLGVDEKKFKSETDQIMRILKNKSQKAVTVRE